MPDETQRAYALKDAVDEFVGASTTYRDGQTLDVSDLLQRGGGTIVTSDPDEIDALDRMNHLLKRVSVPANASSDQPKSKSSAKEA